MQKNQNKEKVEREWELPEDEVRGQFEDYEDEWEDKKIICEQ